MGEQVYLGLAVVGGVDVVAFVGCGVVCSRNAVWFVPEGYMCILQFHMHSSALC